MAKIDRYLEAVDALQPATQAILHRATGTRNIGLRPSPTLTALIANEEQLMRPVIVKQTVNVLRSGETNLAHDDAAIRDGLADVKTHGHSATGERYIRGSGHTTANFHLAKHLGH
jgi:hypothetical protein